MHFAGLIRVDESVKKPKKYIRNNYEKSKIFIDSVYNVDKKILFFPQLHQYMVTQRISKFRKIAE